MRVRIEEIVVKREINPRFELDPDYIEELQATDHWPALVVNRERVLIDGFHRLEAAKRRGDEEIEVEVREAEGDEALALAARLNTIHGKRLTVMELARRIKLLVEEKGWSQEKAGRYFGKDRSWISHYVNISDNLNTTLVTRVTQMDYRSARELARLPQNQQKKAYELAQKLAEQDRRSSPSSRLVAKAVQKIRQDPSFTTDPTPNGSDPDRWLKLTTLWNFASCDPRFGFPFPGRIPGQIVLNLLHYFTESGERVVDPFGGSGTTLDVCRHMNRCCLIYDLKPARDDLVRHDISRGFPEEAKGCDLIFLDPPYWRQKRSQYPKEEGSFSDVDLEAFNHKMEKLIRDCHETIRQGGHVALLIQNTTELGGDLTPTGRSYVDHVFDGYRFFLRASFTPVQRINVPLTWEQFAGFDVKEARERKRMLGVVRDLLVMRKEAG